MNFSLAVYSAPSTQASHTAYRFATALIDQGHSLYRVFFYMDGVHNGSRFTAPPQDEPNLSIRWQKLAHTHNIDLVICIAAALRRGILDRTEADRYEKQGWNLATGFSIGGLGQLLDAAVTSDRVITFGS